MPKFSFYNIAKANAEIDRLSTELAAANAKVEELAQNEPTISAALQGEITQLKATNTELSSRLSAAESKVAELQAKVTETETSVEARASEKALAITQAQGQPQPVKVSANPADGDVVALWQAEQDPTKRAKLYRKHKDQIMAAVFRKK